MKTIIIAAIMSLTGIAQAADYSFIKTGGSNDTTLGTIANEDGLAYDRKFYLNPDIYGGKRLSAVVTYSSVTFADVTFSTNAITIGSAAIAKTAHGLQTGVAVLYTKVAGTDPAPLVDQTTYYAYRYSADIVYVATTAAQAIANDPILIASKTLTGATQTYKLSAIAYAGTPSFKWQGSNDSAYWFDLNTPGITMSSPNLTTTAWDFEWYNFSGIRLNVTAPTTGGILLKAYGNVKDR